MSEETISRVVQLTLNEQEAALVGTALSLITAMICMDIAGVDVATAILNKQTLTVDEMYQINLRLATLCNTAFPDSIEIVHIQGADNA